MTHLRINLKTISVNVGPASQKARLALGKSRQFTYDTITDQ